MDRAMEFDKNRIEEAAFYQRERLIRAVEGLSYRLGIYFMVTGGALMLYLHPPSFLEWLWP